MNAAPRGLHGVLVHALGRKIVEGTLPPGSALSHEALCAEYDAARPTLREALRVLESKGMLRIRPSLGTRVQPVEQWNLLDPDVIAWRLAGQQRDQQVRELAQMRLAIEPVAASLAASAPQDVTVRRLTTALDAMRSAARDDDAHAFTAADVDFHATLLAGSQNQLFSHLTDLIATALEAREESLVQHHLDLSTAALEQHAGVLDAVRGSDPANAEQRMRAMLSALLGEPSPPLAADLAEDATTA